MSNTFMRSISAVRTGVVDFLDVMFPSTGCGEARQAWEQGWRVDNPDQYCARCGSCVGEGEATDTGCASCRDQKLPWTAMARISAYQAPINEWIRQYKFGRMWSWSAIFADMLAGPVAYRIDQVQQRVRCEDEDRGLFNSPQMQAGRVAVVPVPLHWMRRLSRGYDQSSLLAKDLARQLNFEYAPILKRVRNTHAQSALNSHRQRMENVKQAFAIEPVDVSGWQLILVDDVKTSGATLQQCARLLNRAGAKHLIIAVIAVAGHQDANRTRR